MKIRPVGAPSCCMRTDGQTDTTKLIVAFRSFANEPNNGNVSGRQRTQDFI
jgi:hypothetical protein